MQALNVGQTLFDSFTVHSADGTAKVVSITINGANDAAAITGTATGSVIEASGHGDDIPGTPIASGALISTDVDSGSTFQAVSTATSSDLHYGNYTVTAGGTWTYALDNNNATVQALNDGNSLADTFTVHSADGTAKVVSIIIHGATDASSIVGDFTGAVVEAGGVNNTTIPGTPSDSGDLNDVAASDQATAFQAVSSPAASDHGYGTYTVDAAGLWTYHLNNGDATVDALAAGVTLSDSFVVFSADATASQIVTVTITGTNDVPVVGGVVTGRRDRGCDVVAPIWTIGQVDWLCGRRPGAVEFAAQVSTPGSHGYGTFALAADGGWTYTADNSADGGPAAGRRRNDHRQLRGGVVRRHRQRDGDGDDPRHQRRAGRGECADRYGGRG